MSRLYNVTVRVGINATQMSRQVRQAQRAVRGLTQAQRNLNTPVPTGRSQSWQAQNELVKDHISMLDTARALYLKNQREIDELTKRRRDANRHERVDIDMRLGLLRSSSATELANIEQQQLAIARLARFRTASDRRQMVRSRRMHEAEVSQIDARRARQVATNARQGIMGADGMRGAGRNVGRNIVSGINAHDVGRHTRLSRATSPAASLVEGSQALIGGLGGSLRALGDAVSAVRTYGFAAGGAAAGVSVLTAGVLALTAGLAAFVAISPQSFSNALQLETGILQINRALGENSDEFMMWAKNNANAMGAATKDYIKYAGVFGNLLNTFTSSQDDTFTKTKDILLASSRTAAYTGRTMEDVMWRIRSGLLGNTEAIEDLGVNVQVAMLETTDAFKRLANGKSWEQLDFKIQAQIRYLGILEQIGRKYGGYLKIADYFKATRTVLKGTTDEMKKHGKTVQDVKARENDLVEITATYIKANKLKAESFDELSASQQRFVSTAAKLRTMNEMLPTTTFTNILELQAVWTEFTTALGITFTSLANIIAPFLTDIIRGFITAAQAASGFMAAITGSAAAWQKASEQGKALGSILQETFKDKTAATNADTDATKKNTKAIQDNLQSFDEIHKLQKPTSDKDKDDAKADADAFANAFGKIGGLNVMDYLGDWTKVGQEFADLLKSMDFTDWLKAIGDAAAKLLEFTGLADAMKYIESEWGIPKWIQGLTGLSAAMLIGLTAANRLNTAWAALRGISVTNIFQESALDGFKSRMNSFGNSVRNMFRTPVTATQEVRVTPNVRDRNGGNLNGTYVGGRLQRSVFATGVAGAVSGAITGALLVAAEGGFKANALIDIGKVALASGAGVVLAAGIQAAVVGLGALPITVALAAAVGTVVLKDAVPKVLSAIKSAGVQDAAKSAIPEQDPLKAQKYASIAAIEASAANKGLNTQMQEDFVRAYIDMLSGSVSKAADIATTENYARQKLVSLYYKFNKTKAGGADSETDEARKAYDKERVKVESWAQAGRAALADRIARGGIPKSMLTPMKQPKTVPLGSSTPVDLKQRLAVQNNIIASATSKLKAHNLSAPERAVLEAEKEKAKINAAALQKAINGMKPPAPMQVGEVSKEKQVKAWYDAADALDLNSEMLEMSTDELMQMFDESGLAASDLLDGLYDMTDGLGLSDDSMQSLSAEVLSLNASVKALTDVMLKNMNVATSASNVIASVTPNSNAAVSSPQALNNALNSIGLGVPSNATSIPSNALVYQQNVPKQYGPVLPTTAPTTPSVFVPPAGWWESNIGSKLATSTPSLPSQTYSTVADNVENKSLAKTISSALVNVVQGNKTTSGGTGELAVYLDGMKIATAVQTHQTAAVSSSPTSRYIR